MVITSFILNILLFLSGVLVLSKYKKSTGDVNPLIFSVVLIISGICGIVSFIFQSYSGSMASIFFPTGFVCIYMPVYTLVQVCSCRLPITAEYLRSEIFINRGSSSYTPIFKYSFNGNEYESQVPSAYFFKKSLDRKYTCGNTYNIRINEKHPGKCVDRYHVSVIQYFLFAFGLVLLSITALCIINLFSKHASYPFINIF